MAKSNVSPKDTPRQEDSPDEFEVHLEEMSKMKYQVFRKETIQIFKEIQDAMLDNVKWNAEQRRLVLNASKDAFKVNDRLLNLIIDRIENLEKILFVFFFKKGKAEKYEEAKELASMLNINWEKTSQEWKILQEATGGEV